MAKICDFGSVKLRKFSHLSTDGRSAGTPGYMAPEYNTGGGKVTEKADVWAFGCLLAEIFIGRLPWSNRNQFCERDLENPIPPECTQFINSDLDIDARKTVLACLNILPEQRPSARQILTKLQTLGWGSFINTPVSPMELPKEPKLPQSKSTTRPNTTDQNEVNDNSVEPNASLSWGQSAAESGNFDKFHCDYRTQSTQTGKHLQSIYFTSSASESVSQSMSNMHTTSYGKPNCAKRSAVDDLHIRSSVPRTLRTISYTKTGCTQPSAMDDFDCTYRSNEKNITKASPVEIETSFGSFGHHRQSFT